MPNKARTDESGLKSERKKGSDKARKSYDRNGTYSQRHMRVQEALRDKNTAKRTS